MALSKEEVKILTLLGGGIVTLFTFTYLGHSLIGSSGGGDKPFWLLTLTINLLGYSTVLLPGYLTLRYTRDSGYLDRGAGFFASVVRLFFKGKPLDSTVTGKKSINQTGLRKLYKEKGELIGEEAKDKEEVQERDGTFFENAARLGYCTIGLQVSYLTWGVLQEKIMTKDYQDSVGNTGRFNDAQFLVFVNRILAFAVALVAIMMKKQPTHKAPLYKYSYCSLSNIMSSWCQYEALKFVSFPTQVLGKASKVIPVMLMGKVVSNKKYDFYEYIVAVLISLGMMFFLLGKDSGPDTSTVTTFSGAIIMIGYILFDSFTSNWQGALFTDYKMTSVQMMAGVNLFSCLLTSVSLLQQGIFYKSLVFMSQYPRFVSDCVVLSLCSACGQLFIYYTISTFGPVVFTIIMTVRQVLAVVLSCFIYHHSVSAVSVCGIFVVFFALFLKIYCGYKVKLSKKKKPQTGATSKV